MTRVCGAGCAVTCVDPGATAAFLVFVHPLVGWGQTGRSRPETGGQRTQLRTGQAG